MLATNREIEVLNRRENEDIFLAGVQPIRAEMTRLNNLNIDMSRLKLVTIDQQALEPLSPVKPNRPLVVLIGLFLGAILAVFIALAHHAFRSSDNKDVQQVSLVQASLPNPSEGVQRELSKS